MQTVLSSSDPICPVGYINFTKLRLAPKSRENEIDVVVKKSIDYISILNEHSYSDLSDPELSGSELEFIEMESRMKESMSKDEIAIMSRSNSLSHGGTNSLLTSPVRMLRNPSKIDEPAADSSAKSNGSYICNGLDSVLIKAIDRVESLDVASSSADSTFVFEYEKRDINNTPNVAINSKGWMWVSGINGIGATSAEGMQNAVDKLQAVLLANNYLMKQTCFVSLYVKCMDDYAALNAVYSTAFNFTNPPTRVCVECPLPNELQVIMEVVAFRPRTNDTENRRHAMHVQSISHWAPANIGPYAQSMRIGDITYISGQIALIPGNMTIIDGGIRLQCKLALRHIARIAKVMNAHGQLRNVVQGICFVTHPSYISEARRQWERRTENAIMDYILVPALPRKALVEWQVWMHSHNDKFDCE